MVPWTAVEANQKNQSNKICQTSQNADDGKALLSVPELLIALKNRSIDRSGFIKAAQIE